MPADASDVALDGGRGAAPFPCGLPVTGAGEDREGGGEEDIGPLEPVGGGEGLRAEGVPAVATAEARDTGRARLPDEGTVAAIAPTDAGTMEAAIGSRTERGNEAACGDLHVGESLQAVCRPQSSAHNQLNMLRATNSRFAGRSARRRMYHGNQCAP